MSSVPFVVHYFYILSAYRIWSFDKISPPPPLITFAQFEIGIVIMKWSAALFSCDSYFVRSVKWLQAQLQMKCTTPNHTDQHHERCSLFCFFVFCFCSRAWNKTNKKKYFFRFFSRNFDVVFSKKKKKKLETLDDVSNVMQAHDTLATVCWLTSTSTSATNRR